MKIDRLRRFDESARVMWALFLAFWFAYAFAHTLSGCSENAKRDIANFFKSFASCEQRAASGALAVPEQQLIKSINSAISGGVGFDSQEWKNTGISLAATFGADTMACLTSSLWQEVIAKATTSPDMGTKMGMRTAKLSPGSEKYLKAAFTEAAKKVSK
jgi:hypothetical protein